MRLWMIFTVFFSQLTFANEFTIISYNIGGSFLKKQKKGIDNIVRTIGYYQADTHLYQNTFHRYTDTLKYSNIHQYFSYDDGEKKRTSSIETTNYPIISEEFFPLKHCFSFWQNFGIKNVKISFNEKELDVYNVSFPKKKKHAWKNALAIEKYIKRKSREEDFILAIEFNHIKDQNEIIYYLIEKLDLEIVSPHKSPNIETRENKKLSSNVLLIRNKTFNFSLVESYPIFDGTHDENDYLKYSGTLYRLSY